MVLKVYCICFCALVSSIQTHRLLLHERATTDSIRARIGPVVERDALGETMDIGTFYDDRTSSVMSGASLWSTLRLNARTIETETIYSNIEVFEEETSTDKTFTLNVDAEMKLKFLYGLIKVSGSAKLAREQSSSSDISKVSLKYDATTKTKTLPVYTPQDYPEMCKMISNDKGPTHVITSITYGMGATLTFEKEVGKSDSKQEITGNLGKVMKALPNFEFGPTVDFDPADALKKAKMFFSGDLILKKMPASYKQAVEVFDEVNKQARASETPVKYQLTPVGYFCDAAIDVVVGEISQSLTDQATEISVGLDGLASKVKTLLRRDPSIRFESIKCQLLTFESGLRTYSTATKRKISSMITSVKSGEATETKLSELIEQHKLSIWNNGDIFLDHRNREMTTIELVTDASTKHPEVKLSDAGAASDNSCIFNHKYATVYQLYILPDSNIADEFVTGRYTVERHEVNRWYNSLAVVNKVGAVFYDFLTYAKNNFDAEHCFQVRLSEMTDKDDSGYSVIKLYKGGEVVGPDFQPPTAPPTPVCDASTYSSLSLTLDKGSQSKSLVTGLLVTATWRQEKASTDGENGPIDHDFFPTTFEMDDLIEFEIGKLKPDTQYEVMVQYMVDDGAGVSPQSKMVTCKTSSSSAPILPQIVDQTTTTVKVSWNPPQQTITTNLKYIVTASRDCPDCERTLVSENRVETSELSAELVDLEAGMVYYVTIQPFYNGIGNKAVSLDIPTLSYPPDTPSLQEAGTDFITVIIPRLDLVVLHAPLNIRSVLVKYHKINEEYTGAVGGTEMTKTIQISPTTNMQALGVQLENLDAGVEYQIKAALQIRSGAKGRIVDTEDSTGLTVMTQSNDNVQDAQIQAEITAYANSAGAQINTLVATSDSTHGLAKKTSDSIEDKFQTLEYEIRKLEMGELDLLSSGVLRKSCVKRGIRYHIEEEEESHFPGAESEFACLKSCSQQFTDTASITYVVDKAGNGSSFDGNKCYCLKQRHGFPLEIDPYSTSIDRYCWDVTGATTARQKSCVKQNWNIIDKNIIGDDGKIVSSMSECTGMCTTTERDINLALGQPTSQSGNTGGDTSKSSSNAVDGDISGTYKTAFTGKENNVGWWKVTLPSREYIESVHVYNRIDSSQWRLQGAGVYIDNVEVGTIEEMNGVSLYRMPVQRSGREVRIQKTGDYLTLAEVEVFGGACQALVFEDSTGKCYLKGRDHTNESSYSGRKSLGLSCLMTYSR